MKKIAVLVAACALTLTLTGCNYRGINIDYYFNYAQIKMPDGTLVEGEVQAWNDYGDNTLQIIIDDVVYFTHTTNVVLMQR